MKFSLPKAIAGLLLVQSTAMLLAPAASARPYFYHNYYNNPYYSSYYNPYAYNPYYRPGVFTTHPILSSTLTGTAVGALGGAAVGAIQNQDHGSAANIGADTAIGAGTGAALGVGVGLIRNRMLYGAW